VWREKGRSDRAIADYDRAIELDPRLALAYASRGLTRLLQGKTVDAEKDFARCLDLDASLKPFIQERIRQLQ
jgi:tetratricopeptide (TPR) repeat protein